MSTAPEVKHAGWQWPEDMTTESPKTEPMPSFGTFLDETPVAAEDAPAPAQEEEHTEGQNNIPPPRQRQYKPRQCRICLEEVLPTFEIPTEGMSAFFNPAPKVTYVSAESESGRLIRPCKCRGSQAYVHEGCLQEWRHADPRYGERNFWECPTCKFRYRLERMKWSRIISSTLAQIALTVFIMFATVFLLGFIADPIINLYFEPGATIASVATGRVLEPLEFEDDLEDFNGWLAHFAKGLTSIGVLGFVKVMWAMNPITWWNIRQTGFLFGGGGGRNGRVRAGVTGRDRTENTFWLVVLVGVITFLVGVWTFVRRWTRRTLEKAGERVADVHGDDDDEDEDDSQETPQPQPSHEDSTQPSSYGEIPHPQSTTNAQTEGGSSENPDAGTRKTQ